jgi:hypothetical protein
MQRRETILLIGPHKTGSTALQQLLAANRQRLEADGIYYPTLETGTWAESAHHSLVVALQANRHLPDNLTRLLESHPLPRLVLSSENFCRLDESQAAHLRDHLASDKVQIIYVLRRPDRILISFWQEMVKHGLGQRLDEFAAQHLKDPQSSRLLNACHVLDTWAKIFGHDSVGILRYDVAVRSGSGGLAEAFFRYVLKLPPMSEGVEWSNQSFPAETIEILRALNTMYQIDGMRGSFIRERFMEAWQKIEQLLVSLSAILGEYRQERRIMSITDLAQLRDELRASYGGSILDTKTDNQPYHVDDPAIAISFDRAWLDDKRAQKMLVELASGMGISSFKVQP